MLEVIAFLMLAVGCGTGVPVTHSNLRLFASGDSITAEGNGTTPWPDVLMASLPGRHSLKNVASNGSTCVGLKGQYDSQFHAKGMFDRCMLLCGVNDIVRDGASADATYAITAAWLDEMRADNCNPVVMLPTPAKNTGGWSDERGQQYEDYRAKLQAYCIIHGIDCVDPYIALGDGSSPPALAQQYSIDGLHPNQAGENLMASLARAAFQ